MSNNETRFLGRIQLREARVEKRGGGYEATVLREGPGNQGDRNYYTKQALQAAVHAGLFEGLQAYLNHPTAQEERERPGRDVRHLAGQFREARYVDGNPAEVRAKFVPGGMDRDRVVSLIESALESAKDRPLIGISIDGYGVAPDRQEINGQTYNMVREIAHLGSADIVTRAGAGGQFHHRLQEMWREPTALDVSGLLKGLRRFALREGSYDLADGRSVYFDDGKDSMQDAADLYAVLPEETEGGSPNLENLKARHILDRMQTGEGLGQTHVSELRELMAKHQDKIDAYRKRGRDGQDPLAVASDGPDGRIDDPARTQEAAHMSATDQQRLTDARRALDAFTAAEQVPDEEEGKRLIREGFASLRAAAGVEAAPETPAGTGLTLREEMVASGRLVEATRADNREVLEFAAANSGSLVDRMGINPDDLA